MDDIKYSNTHHQHEHSRTNYDDQLDYGTPASAIRRASHADD